MSRWISLIVLLAVIAVTSAVLYRVMAAFILPLFLASVLAVIFRPLHLRIVRKLPTRPNSSALLTTVLIMLTVLLPLAGIATLAVREGLGAVSSDVLDRAETRISLLRRQFDLELPLGSLPTREGQDPISLTDIDRLIEALPDTLPADDRLDHTFAVQIEELADVLQRLNRYLDDLAKRAASDTDPPDDSVDMKRLKRLLDTAGAAALEPVRDIQATIELTRRYATEGPQVFPLPDPRNPPTEGAAQGVERDAGSEPAGTANQESRITVATLRRLYARVPATYAAFRIDLLGGPFWSWLTDLANPSAAQIDSLRINVQRTLRSLLPSVAGQATAIVGNTLLGLAIMSLAVYYFLKDGPAMVQTLMKLSPMEDRYEEALLLEFETVSRAVVLATLLSALAQGVLAGVAYFFAGFESIFLLTSLTIVLAMVPFVGAAAVWFPACLWLALVDQRYVAAIVLFVYGVGVVSMVDNLIKPIVLHGQSKLHPLLALLSVLGGVQALGPIGILVGPMVVSFLQALLNILRHELQALDTPKGPATA